MMVKKIIIDQIVKIVLKIMIVKMIVKIKKNNKCGYGRVYAHKCNNLCKQKQNKRVRKERLNYE